MFYALDGRKLPVIFSQVIPEMVLGIDVWLTVSVAN
jgi:hypothetical protein